MNRARAFLAIVSAGLVAWPAFAGGSPGAASACVACHQEIGGEMAAPVEAWSRDAHAKAGLGCESCHGGDPSPGLAEDPERSMDPGKGFLPAPDRLGIPDFCARCHADAAYMKRFNPQARVDQLSEYRTSVHGRKNAAGDPVPAVCTDCHGVHGMLEVASSDSPVYPTRVPGTCAQCHSDGKRMAPYGIPTGQYEAYRTSVHAAALLDGGDLAAPACNDCHGNHGAAPPGVDSVANVCGQCHAREANLFDASFKKEVFDDMEVSQCVVCHENHAVRHPTPDLFHGGSAPALTRGEIVSTEPLTARIDRLEPGQTAELTWISVLNPYPRAAEDTPRHRVEIAAGERPPLVVDAGVDSGLPPPGAERQAEGGGLAVRLWLEPRAGRPVKPGDALHLRLQVAAVGKAAVRGLTIRDHPAGMAYTVAGSVCLTCHSPGDDCDQATEKMYGALVGLERDLRGAEALLRRAEVAGMEVSGAHFALKSGGTSAQVEARALIHSFDTDRLLKRTADGRSVAADAVHAGQEALAELERRRHGLAVSLVLILMVMIALSLKIRQVSRRQVQPGAEEDAVPDPGARRTGR